MLIASRTLLLRQADDQVEIGIRLYLPEETAGAWICRYEVDWPHAQRKHAAHGEDSIQAIVLALKMVGAELYSSAYHKSGDLFFLSPGQGYGFPVANNIRDLLIGDDAEFF